MLNSSYVSENERFYYVVDADNEAEIIGCETTSTELTIPETINGYAVTKIGDYGFKDCATLQSITIPNNITRIGNYAFENCTGMVNATIPTTIDSVGEYAFLNCTGLVNVTISEGVESIGKGCFYNCVSLVEAVVPDTVTSLGAYAFYGCTSLQTATIGISAEAVNEYTFYGCSSLTTVVVGMSVDEIGDYAFYNCALTRVTLPMPVARIGKYAFAGNRQMTRATLRSGIATIDAHAFEDCVLLSTVTLPSGLTELGAYAFDRCESLTRAVIPSGVTVLNDGVFDQCTALATVTINGNVTSIGFETFRECAFETIALPGTLETIGGSAFRGCPNLISVTVPDATTYIGHAAFYDAPSLVSVSLPDVTGTGHSVFGLNSNLTATVRSLSGTVADGMFEQMDISHVILDSAITGIGDSVFAYCYNLEDVTYGDAAAAKGEFRFSPNVRTMGAEAFKDATCLKNLIIPNLLQSVGTDAFYNPVISNYNTEDVTVTFYLVNGGVGEGILQSQKVSHIVVNDGINALGNNAFNGISILETVSLPDTIAACGTGVFADSSGNATAFFRGVDGTIDSQVYNGKTAGLTSLVIGDGIFSIGDYAFANATSVTSLEILGSDLYQIGEHAFEEGKLIPSVVLPDSVRVIGAYAFYDCNSLESINIPSGIESINHSTFYGCASLQSVNLPDTVTRIGPYAYYGCVLIDELTLGNALQTIGEYAFYNCNAVTEMIIPQTVQTIGNYAFRGCSKIKAIALPNSVTSLGDCVFYGCVGLEDVDCGLGITSIGDRVFYACVALNSVLFNGDVDSIHELAFYGAEDAVVYAYANDYVEAYCDEMGLEYVDLAGNFTMILTPPTKTEYSVGEELDLTGLLLDVTFENGVNRTVQTGYVVSGYDSNAVGTQTVTVTYKGKSQTFEVTVNASETEPVFSIAGASMTLGNELSMNFFIRKADLNPKKEYYVRITKTYADGRTDRVKTIPIAEWTNYNATYYRITFDGVTSKEMNDTIYVQAFHTDDTPASEVWEDSVVRYVTRIIESQNAYVKTMLVDMLNYGSASQTFFGYDTSNLANGSLTETQKGYATGTITFTDSRVSGTNYRGSSLNLANNLRLNMFFDNIDPSMYAMITYTNHQDVVKGVRIDGSKFEHYSGTTYRVVIDELMVPDARKLVTCTVYDAEDRGVANASDSIESYVARMSSTDALYETILKFADSAYAYFHH